jgi:NAD(P)-dependent dehydrogenase (short-subunit alcohol dehydrogenase family)
MSEKYMIYGSTGGVGSAVCQLLHKKGCELHLVARDEEKLNAQAQAFDASFTLGDVLDTELFSKAASEAGDVLAGLVYAIGTISLQPFRKLKAETYENDFKINALGPALAVQSALPALKKSPFASIVFYSSVAAERGFSYHASIGMAKAAVSGLTRSLAAELAPRIRVNAIAPSLTQTPLASHLLADEKIAAAITQLHALKRLGTPEDIGSATTFLLSEASSWITGQVIGVDGGRSTL